MRTLPQALLLKLAVAAALSLVVVMLAPISVDAEPGVPPGGMLLATGSVVALICAVLLAWGLRTDLGLPLVTAVYAVVFNAAVIAVKLVLAPYGLYEVNQVRDLSGWLTIDDPFMALLVGGMIFVLYFGVYYFLFWVFRSKVEPLVESRTIPRFVSGRAMTLTVVVFSVLLVATGGALLLALIPLAAGLEYLDFVFASGLSLAIALVLACATAFAAMALNSAADRARLVGDAAVFMSVFWVGLYFLALYHALWVVYVILLTSIWPLKVVTPK
jgi:hypothetical protein